MRRFPLAQLTSGEAVISSPKDPDSNDTPIPGEVRRSILSTDYELGNSRRFTHDIIDYQLDWQAWNTTWLGLSWVETMSTRRRSVHDMSDISENGAQDS
ncbi:uncharacterized protein CLUP02_13249 [Colletotrichum lupini]|uniref:Uncharacterized protein n=1 Tax=Colletotrichum lupini TaxID=145971 RepID=A0A9Q8T2Q9_9PEZI|nr:uncharacterized protein CLUP02_13249 [Colletotrichum lupini]UQC87730.1 hypothetical protein CLUP02_13249 [Colletotrichum lupini]